MTLLIWDASHYDGTLTRAILARAAAEGIVGLTHKVGEGTGGDDPEDATALAAGRDVGMDLLGGYHVVRSGPVAAQVDALLQLANRDEPWWPAFPGWVWQVDLERWSYDNVPASTGIAFAKLLRERTQRQVFLYASHGQYADQLAGWDGPLWNADYASRPVGTAAAMYPGDNWQPQHSGWVGGWAPYSGQSPTILQYTSSATIAGLTTCDANAFRGTIEQFRALIEGNTGMVYLDDSPANPQRSWLQHASDWSGNAVEQIHGVILPSLARLEAATAADETRDKATLAAFTALAAGGSSVDTAAVVTAVAAVRDEARTQFTQLHAENAALKAELDAYKAREAQAAQAEADALKAP